MKVKYPDNNWKNIAGFRDVLIHSYFKINLLIIWDVVENKLPHLKNDIKKF
ncbi:HepT-like ribonuclease domain-containing protein [Methanothermococcus sp. Ax23]|uniref:HepT-like ribonuclease domain-containing protein n=1 Tax=Methanothermococcus sp. Ax23 TaxID=3156486 RepID=UPI003BA16CCB